MTNHIKSDKQSTYFENSPEIKEIERLLKAGELTGKELSRDQKEALKKGGILYEYIKDPREIQTQKDFEELRELYEDLKNDEEHEGSCFCPSCLYQISSKIIKRKINKDNFFFGFLLLIIIYSDFVKAIKEILKLDEQKENIIFMQAFLYFIFGELKKKDCRKRFRHNWEAINYLMFSVEENGMVKYPFSLCSSKERNRIYKIGSRYLGIVAEALEVKIKVNEYMYALKNTEEKIKNFENSRAGIKVLSKFGYDINLTRRIHSYIMKYCQEERNPMRLRNLERRFSKKRIKDILPCLWFLERHGEIFCDMSSNSKKVYYLGDGKNLEEALPADVSSFTFPEKFKKLFKDALADTILIK